MPDPQLTRLHEVVTDLSAQVAQLTARVQGLEQRSVPVSTLPASSDRERIESRFGLTVVNRIGALTLALGIAFFFKYAVDNAWVGPGLRVLIGLAAGAALIAAAEFFRRRKEAAFSQGLAGCGLAALYISLYAASAFYKLISAPVSFIGLILVCAFAVVLSVASSSAAIAALGFAGALLTPLLLHALPAAALDTYQTVYFFLIDLAAVAIATLQGWRVLIPLTAAATVLAALAVLEPSHRYEFVVLLLVLAALHFRAFPFGANSALIRSYTYSTFHALFLIAALRFLSLQLIAYTTPLNRASVTSEADSVLLAVYAVTLLVYGIARQRPLDRSIGLALLALVIAKLYCWDVWQLNYAARITAFVLLGVVLLAASWIYSRFRARA